MSETFTPPSTPRQAYLPETFTPREVTRLVDRHLNVPGAHVANFVADVEAMLREGQFYGLDDRDFRFLTHALTCSIRPADTPEGSVVSMSGRQWGRFIGARRVFLHAKRQPSNVIAHLRSKHLAAPSSDIETNP